jgi:iron complex outermembrane receptor protein
MNDRKRLGGTACVGVTTLLIAATAHAQTAPPPQPPPADAEPPPAEAAPTPSAGDDLTEEELLELSEAEAQGEVIVVTGTRISDPLGKQAPVRVLAREDLERTGLASVGDILQQLPASGGAINSKFNSSGNFGYPPDGGGIGAGAIEADLRYLGSKRVLVLVDGVRWVNGSSASGVSAATDLNTIPLGMVERIEVLEDGASPIYGSDAIAGVINIITRKEFSGVIASAYVGGYQPGEGFGDGAKAFDGFTHKYDVSWGGHFDKLSVVAGVSFLDQRRALSADREISNSPIVGLDACEDGCSSATPQGRVLFTDPMTGEDRDITLNNGAVPAEGNYHEFAASDRFNFAPYNLILTPSRRASAFAGVSYKLAERTSARAKLSYTFRQSQNQAGPEPLFVGPEGGNGNRMDRIAIDVTNPYNPFGFTFDPATNPFVVTRRPIEAGPRLFEQNVNTVYASAGVDGKVDAGSVPISWDATAAYGLNIAKQHRTNSFNSARLEQALGPAYMENGVWRCGTQAAPGDPRCVPFNIFGGQGPDGSGTITPEMLEWVTFEEDHESEQQLIDAVANVSAELVKLPAGSLAIAVGAEHRRLRGSFDPDPVTAAGNSADVPAQPTKGDYSVTEAYAELRLPLVAGARDFELLDVNAAGRVSKYSFLGAELTGKVGARWKPTKELVLRASYGRGFRAPSIGELFASASRFDAMLNDPCSDFDRPEVTQAVRDRCVALGVPADGSYEQLNPQISVTTGGNRDLEPETSESINVSFGVSPSFLQDQKYSSSVDLEVAFWQFQLDGAISALDAQLQLDRCVSGGDDTLCSGIVRTGQGSISSFSNVLQNIGGIDTRGIDMTLRWATPTSSAGRFRVTSVSSWLLQYHERIPAEGGFSTVGRESKLAGEPERAFPQLKSSLWLDWFYKRVALTFTTRFISGVEEQCRGLQEFPGTCSDPVPENDDLSTNELPAVVYNDIQVLWTPEFAPALTLTAGVNNVFEQDPPVCYSCALNGFNATTYDVPGLFGYLSASYHLQ